MKKIFLFLLFAVFLTTAYAQKKIKYTKAFLAKKEQVQIDIYTPVEGKYKSTRPAKNDYQAIDHIIYSKKEALEIRYAIIPFEENKPTTQIPHVDFMRVVMSTATNEAEDAVVSVHAIPDRDLKANFNADWGSMAYFQPKMKFSKYKHCRLVSLYSEGHGMVYVFFLFDEPSRFLDNRLHSLRFRTKL